MHYPHFLDVDLSVSVVESIFNTEEDIKERGNRITNGDFNKKKLYLELKKKKKRQRENQAEGRTGECLINKN